MDQRSEDVLRARQPGQMRHQPLKLRMRANGGQIGIAEQMVDGGESQPNRAAKRLERFRFVIQESIAARQVIEHLSVPGAKPGQSQVDLQGPPVATFSREEVAQIHEDFDVIGVPAENSLEEFDFKINLRAFAKGSQTAACGCLVVRQIRALLIFARHTPLPVGEQAPI